MDNIIKKIEYIRKTGIGKINTPHAGAYKKHVGKIYPVEDVLVNGDNVRFTLNIAGISTDFYNQEVEQVENVMHFKTAYFNSFFYSTAIVLHDFTSYYEVEVVAGYLKGKKTCFNKDQLVDPVNTITFSPELAQARPDQRDN